MPRLICIDELAASIGTPARHEVARMRAVLSCQGQIEPVVLNSAMELGHCNWYDPALVQAARELGWRDVLVTWPGEGRADR